MYLDGFFRFLCAILGPWRRPSYYTAKVQGTTHKCVAHTWYILHTAASHKDHTVFLEIMSFTRNIRRHCTAIRQPYTRHFSNRRVWLLRLRRENFRTDAFHEGTSFQCRHSINWWSVWSSRPTHRLLQSHIPYRRRLERTHWVYLHGRHCRRAGPCRCVNESWCDAS